MLPSIIVRGGSVFATDPGQDGATWKGQAMWMPRVSAAYKLGERTVVKAGYGLYYDTLNAGDSLPNQTGYSVTTTTGNSSDLGRTFLVNLNTRHRRSVSRCAPTAPGSMPRSVPRSASTRMLGNAFTAENLNREHSRQQRWRVSVQRELRSNLSLEVAYSGSYSDRIGRNIRQDYLPEQYWNDSNERNTTANTFLTANVTNPFRITNFASLQTSNPVLYNRLAGNTFFTSTTIQRNRLLRAFPADQQPDVRQPAARGREGALARDPGSTAAFPTGLSGVFSFAANSVRENRIVEEFDRAPTIWQGNNGGRPYRVTASGVYELPFGSGRAFLNEGGVLSRAGGRMAGRRQLRLPARRAARRLDQPVLLRQPEDIPVDNPTLDRWFNTDAGFEKDPAKTPAGFQKR